jgi:SAM-dependent methyltransferase
MLRYLEAFGQVVGCDRERAALVPSFLKAVPPNGVGGGTQVVQAEAEHLPFKPESLDLVTMLDLLEHIADDRGVLSDVGRILRPKGILCVTVPVYRWLWGNQDLISRHVRRYQPGELERKIEAAGLCILYQTYFNTFLFPVVAMIRLIRRGRALLGGCYAGLDPDRLPSDFSMTKPGRLNDALAWIFSQEARWLRRWRFPMGVSLLCLAQKPAAPLEGPLPLAQELNS